MRADDRVPDRRVAVDLGLGRRKGALDPGEGRIIERLGQIDAKNLGTQRGAGGNYLNRH